MATKKPKSNKEAIMRLAQEINKKDGAGMLYTIGSQHANLKVPRWSTGIEDLDAIIGGGMPEGRTVEIYGPEGSGKTTLLYHLFALHETAVDFPVEGTFDAQRAELFGNRRNQLLIARTKCGEECMNKAIRFARAGVPIIGIDSVPSLIPKDDLEKVEKAVNRNSIEEQRIGGTARLLNKYLPALEDIIEVTGTTVIFTNQVRDKMNAMLFGEKTDTPGGHKLKHSCSLRIQVARRAWIDIKNYNPSNSAANERIGMIMKCKVTKSKVSNPMGECEIPLIFPRGFVSFADYKQVIKEIADERKEFYSKRKSAIESQSWDALEDDDYEVVDSGEELPF